MAPRPCAQGLKPVQRPAVLTAEEKRAFRILVQRLDDIDMLQCMLPFGKELTKEITRRLYEQYLCLTLTRPLEAQNPTILPLCQKVHRRFAKWRSWYEEYELCWLEKHETIGVGMVDLLLCLPRSGSPPFGGDDLIWGRTTWRREVLRWIRKVFPLTVRPKLTSSRSRGDPNQEWMDLEEEHRGMDVCYRVLAKMADDASNFVAFRTRCQQHLTELCLRRYYIPQELLKSGITRSDRECLNNGGSADVYHGFFGPHEVAIKSFRMRQDTAAYVQKAFAKEAMLLSTLNHENIVTFRGVVVEGSELCLITDWMSNGDITQYVVKTPHADKEFLINQIAEGLEYLHMKGMVHGDLKGENVLVDQHGRARLADFGLASVEGADYRNLLKRAWSKDLKLPSLTEGTITIVTTLATTVGGTPRWMSPERLVPAKFGRKSTKPCAAGDVWAFGLLCYEIYTGLKPYHEFSGLAPIIQIVQGVLPQERDEVPWPVWSIIRGCWVYDPDDRPNMTWIRWRVEEYRRMLERANYFRQFRIVTILGREWGVIRESLDEIFKWYPSLRRWLRDMYNTIRRNDRDLENLLAKRGSDLKLLAITAKDIPQQLRVPPDCLLSDLKQLAILIEGREIDFRLRAFSRCVYSPPVWGVGSSSFYTSGRAASGYVDMAEPPALSSYRALFSYHITSP